MKRNLLLVVVALCAAGVLWAAEPTDFAMKIVPANTVIGGTEGGTASGSVNMVVTLDTIAGNQGWSFGAILVPGAGATMHITAFAIAGDTMTIKNGAKPDFASNLIFESDDLANSAGGIDLTTMPDGVLPAVPSDICVAITQGIVIDFMQGISLAASTDFEMATFTVAVTGPVGAAVAEIGQVQFTDAVGNPATPTVAVHGGGSIAPAVKTPAIISTQPLVCAAANDFSIWLSGGECATGAEVESTVTLNFNGNGTNGGVNIQGWSYGVCTDPLLEIVGASTAGTDAATVKNGVPGDFNTVTIYPGEGVTHAVVIDFMAAVVLPSRNDFSDLKITMNANVTEADPVANIRTCNTTLGAPPTANVMVIGGASLAASGFDGVLADRASDTGCCAAALAGDGKACNKPAEFTFSPGAKFKPGNANGDAKLDLADGIFILSYLFRGGRAPGCEAALDVNGDGVLDASDAIMIFYWQFLDGPAPALGTECGVFELTTLTCDVQEDC